ncbi:MAG: serine/threonine-protein kinase PknK, partial [Chloroflexi bacterium]|nr:serine/threonine-protein kinase PknK [Chloroflexota bacterium]
MSLELDGRYHLQDKIGEGGMGAVYKVIDRKTGDTVALKQVNLPVESFQFITDPVGELEEDYRLALTREFQTLASLHHPYIISVQDYGFDREGKPFYTMSYLSDAQTIQVAGKGKSNSIKILYLQQVLQALAYLHRRKVLHRDLKPENLLVADGSAFVLDFGLSSPLVEGDAFSSGGTLAYLAPEVWEDYKYSPTSDIYAIGVIAYEMLVGKHPFAPIDANFIERVLEKEPDFTPLVDTPALARVIERLLIKDPDRRFQNADDVVLAFDVALNKKRITESLEVRESYLQAATFVGREKEMKQLQTALTRAEQGDGSVWLIGGESGVGK